MVPFRFVLKSRRTFKVHDWYGYHGNVKWGTLLVKREGYASLLTGIRPTRTLPKGDR